MTWTVDRRQGSAADFHALDLPVPMARALWWFEVTGDAVVLGSTQSDDHLDRWWAEDLGIEVARRRSGGGAVWLSPGQVTWVDVLLPSNDRLWDDDIVRAASWLGDAWVAALGSLGVEGAEAHHGGLVTSSWSHVFCFAGLGPGEVTVGGQKVVGISQRRTRAGARFQCAVLHRWDPNPLIDLFQFGQGTEGALARRAVGVEQLLARPVASEAVVAALLASLPEG